MREEREPLGPSSAVRTDDPGPIWATAASVAALGDWILYDALPGIGWVLWTAAAVAGLFAFTLRPGHPPRSILIIGGIPIVIAGAAGVTANPVILALICVAVVFLLAMQMLLTSSVSLARVTASFAAFAPLSAFRVAVVESMRRTIDATNRIRSTRARGWVRGLAITLPVLIAFALLLAGADPVFAAGRDAIGKVLTSWDFVPRAVFFVGLLVIVLGAYGYASLESEVAPTAEGKDAVRWLGATERLMLLGGVTGLLWLFVAVQVGYLFGNLPHIANSGVTFAEYARRGFGELSIVASGSAVILVVSERYGISEGRARTLRFVSLALVAAVLLLLASAFRRVSLYEAAYGFTTARLYAQVYMCAVAAGLVMLSREVAGRFDAGRLFRRAAAAVMTLFIALIYWNHEGWIARRNLERFASTGKLDVAYLAQELSPDAIPAIAERLPSLPEPVRSELHRAVRERYAEQHAGRQRAWFEWNLARSRARRAIEEHFAVASPEASQPKSMF